MDQSQHSAIVAFIWNIADDVLRDVYVRGKYRDVILPMTVIRRLDALLEPTKQAVLDLKESLDEAGIVNQDDALRHASRQAFHNTSAFRLRDLMSAPTQLKGNFEAYLDGFSANVREIVDHFGFRGQLERLAKADVLGQLLEKFLDPRINLSPEPVRDADGNVRLPGLSNHGMGYVFEELIRRFNEENNEEAGEHFTPREIVRLMASLLLLPVRDRIESGSYLVYDCACGTGGMLTEADATLRRLAAEHGRSVTTHLYGQEVNDEIYAICKGDLLIKGEDERNIQFGSTLSQDAFATWQFDFMLSNPPYGKSWKADLVRLCSGAKKTLRDPRFIVTHAGDPEFRLVTRSSDGQLMFLANMLSKMKRDTSLGSRVAIVLNGSSLLTGDAGQGESNVRRWIIENDWLEAVIALPLNMFYNTGIATYIWVLTNRKPQHRQGRVQLIDATGLYQPLRKNLGKKNCELSGEHIRQITDLFLAFDETPQSKRFPNEAFGYWKVTVERPLRLVTDLSVPKLDQFERACRAAKDAPLASLVQRVASRLGPGPHLDYNAVLAACEQDADQHSVKLTAGRVRLLRSVLTATDEAAASVIRKVSKPGKTAADPLHGLYEVEADGRIAVVEYEPDSALRDAERVPLLEEGGIEAFFRREVLPHVPDAWIDPDRTEIGYEIPFTRHFFVPPAMRSLDEIRTDLEALQAEAEGLLEQIVAPEGARA